MKILYKILFKFLVHDVSDLYTLIICKNDDIYIYKYIYIFMFMFIYIFMFVFIFI